MTTPEQPLSEDEIAAIRARLDAATPGPWEVKYHHPAKNEYPYSPYIIAIGPLEASGDGMEVDYHEIDAPAAAVEFIAHAPDDIRRLIAEVRRLRAENADLHQQLAATVFKTPTFDIPPERVNAKGLSDWQLIVAPPSAFHVGQRVRIASTEITGVIRQVDESVNMALVRVSGGIQDTWCSFTYLEPIAAAATPGSE